MNQLLHTHHRAAPPAPYVQGTSLPAPQRRSVRRVAALGAWRVAALGAWLGLLVGSLTAPAAAETTDAGHALPPLNCAIEAAPAHARGLEGLCAKLSKELGREVRTVDDVRRAGAGVQIIATDVTWYVVLVEGGKVRAFTRISAIEARGRELSFVKSAIRALSTAAPKAPAPCLRIDPATAATGSDVVYPWAELVPCTRTVLDVRDPWWAPVPRR
jgi:hypothetical protein